MQLRGLAAGPGPTPACQTQSNPLFALVPQSAAAAAGVAPSQLVSDFSLWEMVRLRPGQAAALQHCQGCSEVFVRAYGQVTCRA